MFSIHSVTEEEASKIIFQTICAILVFMPALDFFETLSGVVSGAF